MRVISGRWGGRILRTAKGTSARPTSDRVREAVFNIIYDGIIDAVVVDLFAGSGSFGIEALSRGAQKAYFCDSEKHSVEAIGLYLNKFGAKKQDYELYAMDYSRAIKKMVNYAVEADIVYIDPPYKAAYYEDVLFKLKDILKPMGLVIVEHDKRLNIDFPQGYEIMDKRKYGNTVLHICRLIDE